MSNPTFPIRRLPFPTTSLRIPFVSSVDAATCPLPSPQCGPIRAFSLPVTVSLNCLYNRLFPFPETWAMSTVYINVFPSPVTVFPLTSDSRTLPLPVTVSYVAAIRVLPLPITVSCVASLTVFPLPVTELDPAPPER